MLFKLKGELILDPNKPTIAFYDKGDTSGYTHIYGPARIIKEELRKYYNIIVIGTGCKLENNYYGVSRDVTEVLLRKADDPENYIKKNAKVINGWMEESFKDLPVLDYIILGTDDFFRLPLTGYISRKVSTYLSDMQNEFFDYIGEDQEILDTIKKGNQKVVNEYDRLVSPIAFSTKDYNLFMRSIDFINRTGRLKNNVIGFSIDPAIYTPFFDELNIPSKFYYFAEDKRGTRNFEQLDISQLQHIIYDRKYTPDTLDDWSDSDISKTHNMFFAGTIFQEKGSRTQIWKEFLDGVKSENCSYYIPLRKNGIIKSVDGPNERQINILEERFPELYNEVKNHPHFKGGLPPELLHERQRRYKYGMVFRCVSVNDSLNFRPVLYAYEDILPFLDYQYDPAYLQIPKHMQDKLVVHSAEDIDARIKYYNENDDERIIVLNELKELFRINEYINNPVEMLNEQINKIIPDFNK